MNFCTRNSIFTPLPRSREPLDQRKLEVLERIQLPRVLLTPVIRPATPALSRSTPPRLSLNCTMTDNLTNFTTMHKFTNKNFSVESLSLETVIERLVDKNATIQVEEPLTGILDCTQLSGWEYTDCIYMMWYGVTTSQMLWYLLAWFVGCMSVALIATFYTNFMQVRPARRNERLDFLIANMQRRAHAAVNFDSLRLHWAKKFPFAFAALSVVFSHTVAYLLGTRTVEELTASFVVCCCTYTAAAVTIYDHSPLAGVWVLPLFVWPLLGTVVDRVYEIAHTVAAGKTRRRNEAPLRADDIHCWDGNKRKNIARINYVFNRYTPSHSFDLDLDGHTHVNRGSIRVATFDFPVYCDDATFRRYLQAYINYPQLRLRLKQGVVDAETYQFIQPLFARVLTPRFFGLSASVGNALGLGTLLTSFALDPFMPFYIFPLLLISFVAESESLAYSFLEETFNEIYGVHYVAWFELIARLPIIGFPAFLPFMFHYAVHIFPFPVRVVLHFLYNNSKFVTDFEHISASTADVVSMTASVLDFYLKAQRRDMVGIALTFGMNAKRLETMYNSDVVQAMVDEIVFLMHPPAVVPLERQTAVITSSGVFEEEDETGLVTLSGEREDKRSFLYDWVPSAIRRSPTFSKLVALTFVIVSSSWFSSIEPLRAITNYMSSEEFQYKGSMASTVVGGVQAFYNGINRVLESGDPMAFFEASRDVKFTIEAHDLLKENPAGYTVEETIRRIAAVRVLIEQRQGLNNPPDVSRLLDKLRAYEISKEGFLRVHQAREMPMAFFFVGESGTGKTTISDCLLNFLAERDGVPRKAGDTINFAIDDKYPTSTGAHESARYLVMNDITGDYTQFPTRDLMPLDLLLQKIFDTYPLSFRAAAVEDKGQVFNNIKYVFISSNHRTFVCCDETKKLVRRIDGGVIVEYAVEHGDFAQFKKLDYGDRNDKVAFKVLDVSSENKHLKLRTTSSTETYRMRDFFAYVDRRITEFEDEQGRATSAFKSKDNRCACGLPHVYHLTGTDPTAYYGLSTRCEHPESLKLQYPDFVEAPVPRKLGVAGFFGPETLLVLFLLGFSKPVVSQFADVILNCASGKYWDLIRERFFTSEFCAKLIEALKGFPQYVYQRAVLNAMRTFYRLKQFVRENAKYLAVASALGVGVMAWFASSGAEETVELLRAPIFAKDVDPESMDIGIVRQEQNYEQRVRIAWNKKEDVINVVSLSKKNVGEGDLISLVAKCTLSLKFTFVGEETMDSRAFLLNPDFIIFNKHYLRRDGSKTLLFPKSVWYMGVEYPIETKGLIKSKHSEFIYWRHCLPLALSACHSFLLEDIPNVPTDVTVVLERGNVSGVGRPAQSMINGEVYPVYAVPGDGRKGDCSSPMVGKFDGGSAIIGFISFGGPVGGVEYMGACVLTRKMVAEDLESDPLPFVEDYSLTLLGNDHGPLSVNSALRAVPSPFILTLGTIPGAGATFTSNFRKSRLYDDVSVMLSEPYAIPSKTRYVDNEKQFHTPMTHTFKYINKVCNISLWRAQDYAERRVERQFGPLVRAKNIRLAPLDLSEAIFGEEKMGIGRIEFNTSVGPTLKKLGMSNKYDMFVGGSVKEHALRPEVLAEVKVLKEKFEKAILAVPIADMVIKDEIRTLEKVDVAKLRIFSVMDTALNLLARCYLMPLITLLLDYRERSECYGGMNAGSPEWDELAKRLKGDPEKLRKFFDMDFSAFDTSHGRASVHYVACYFFFIALLCGYSRDAASMCYLLVKCLDVQLVKFFGDLFLKLRGLPSGFLATLIFNSLVNGWLLEMAYDFLVGGDEYEEKVTTANVGDDNVNGVDGDIADRFNMITIQRLYEGFGYVVTPAKKDGTVVPTIPFEDLTFLKRTFLEDPEFGYMAPLAKDSLLKALCFEPVRSGTSSVARLEAAYHNALREAFLHGREYFDQFATTVGQKLRDHQMVPVDLKFDDLRVEYSERRFKTTL